MNLDILAICPHPDDAELHCAGMLMNARQHRAAVGVLDLSAGELGSRGNADLRAKEAAAATQLLGLAYRENLGLPDGFIGQASGALALIIAAIRFTRPRLIAAPHWNDHHPDHVATSHLVREAAYLAGLQRYPVEGTPHRPEQVLYYLDRVAVEPSLIVDISAVMSIKEQALRCYGSQLHRADSQEPETLLASADFFERWRARHLHYGSLIGVGYGEAYVLRSPVPIQNPLELSWQRQGMV